MLAFAKLQHQLASRLQMRPALRRQQTIKLQAIRAAIQSQARIEIANLRLQRRNLGTRNVRRIADDQVERNAGIDDRKAIARVK